MASGYNRFAFNFGVVLKKNLVSAVCYLILVWVAPIQAFASDVNSFKHWVGMYPDNFEFNYVDASWTVKTYESPFETATALGEIEISFNTDNGHGTGLSAVYISKHKTSSKEEIVPHLYDPDWGYGPWFHLTVLDVKQGWVKVEVSDKIGEVWADFGKAFGNSNIAFHELQVDDIYRYDNKPIVIEYLNSDALIVRDEQPIDMHCGDEILAYKPYTTWEIDRSDWINTKGISRFSVPYTRGC